MKPDILLYGILDPEHCGGRNLAKLAFIAATNGATLLQYRDKVNDAPEQIKNVLAILKALQGTKIPLIINDHVNVAAATKAGGVHLGQSDMNVEEARKILGTEKFIGLSIKTREEAKTAPVDEIDYAFIGGVFETKSKINPSGIGIAGWQDLANILRAKRSGLPIGAIAGITSANVGEIMEAGADGVALISGLFLADDVAVACQTMRRKIASVR